MKRSRCGLAHLKVRDSKVSFKETKSTNQKNTAKQKSEPPSTKSDLIAAAISKKTLEEEKNQKGSKTYQQSSTASNSQNKVKSEASKQNTGKEIKDGKIDYIINEELLSLLDSAGVSINRTIKDLLKLYSLEKVEGA